MEKEISKEQFQKAINIVSNYRLQSNEKLVKQKTCVKCENNIVKPIEPKFVKPLQQEDGMWENGTVITIQPTYGSKHDNESYYGGICDECLDHLKEKNIIEQKIN